MPSATILHDALRPFRGAPLIFVVATTPMFTFARVLGLAGWPLRALLASWAWTYAYLLIEATARGQPAPVLSIEQTVPWQESRPLANLVMLIGALGIAYVLARDFAPWVSVAWLAFVTAVFPASMALLAVDAGGLKAFWPPALVQVAMTMGTDYLAVFALGAGYATLLAWMNGRMPTMAVDAAAQFVLFSLATALGGAIFRRRHALGLDPWASPEREDERRQREETAADNAFCAEVYGLLRAHRHDAAWAQVALWLATAHREPSAYRWLSARADHWGEPRFQDRLTRDFVARLLALGRRGEAVEQVEACWRRGGDFVADDPRDQAALEATARQIGHDATLERLRATVAAPHH